MSLLQISPAVHRLVWQRLRPQILSSSALMVKRSYIGDYDKKKKLLPKDVTYKYGDDRFLKGPTYNDEPFLKPTEDEIIELTRVKLEDEIMAEQITKVDPQQEPFTEVLEGFPDTGKFTKVETVDIEGIWFWVDRLKPKQVVPTGQTSYDSRLGLPPLPEKAPDLPYFIARTRSNVYPVYRIYQVVGRDRSTYWKNRWDGLFNKYHTDILENLDEIKHENNEKTIVITQVNKIQGDIWRCEHDLREFLEKKLENKSNDGPRERLLSSVFEPNGSLQFKGDFVQDIVNFLQEKQF